MKKSNLIILISLLSSILLSLTCIIFSNFNLIVKNKFINIIENMIKILLKNKELESIDYVFNSLILLKRIQKIEFISEKGLRIIKNKDIKKKKAKLYNITKEIYESNKYYGILKITLIV